MFAVRRGFNFRSGLSAEITTSYVTTVDDDDEFERISEIFYNTFMDECDLDGGEDEDEEEAGK